MAKRKIIKINQEKCNGCGQCIPNCPEGALQIIDGKARLISDLFCDGLGACIGSCPVGAITIEEREAEKYDEKKVMVNIIKQGENTIKAHLAHLRDHGEQGYLKEAIQFLKEKGAEVPQEFARGISKEKLREGCPGVRVIDFSKEMSQESSGEEQPSSLRQWPIQLHLVSTRISYFQGKDILLSADCVAFAYNNFHSKYLKGKYLAIACPKLDTNQNDYRKKITALVDEVKINTITVMIMEVPCCRGLLTLTQEALKNTKRKVPLKCVVVGINGKILSEEWISMRD
jgi:ferredoxin